MILGQFLAFLFFPTFSSQMISPADRIGGVQNYLGRGMSNDHIIVLLCVLGIVAAFIFLIIYSYLKEKNKHGNSNRNSRNDNINETIRNNNNRNSSKRRRY